MERMCNHNIEIKEYRQATFPGMGHGTEGTFFLKGNAKNMPELILI